MSQMRTGSTCAHHGSSGISSRLSDLGLAAGVVEAIDFDNLTELVAIVGVDHHFARAHPVGDPACCTAGVDLMGDGCMP